MSCNLWPNTELVASMVVTRCLNMLIGMQPVRRKAVLSSVIYAACLDEVALHLSSCSSNTTVGIMLM